MIDAGEGTGVDPATAGRPLPSGFAYRPASEVPEMQLAGDALKRVLEKMDAVDEARLRAAESSSQSYIG